MFIFDMRLHTLGRPADGVTVRAKVELARSLRVGLTNLAVFNGETFAGH
jgi:hypothetical protein